MKLDFEQYFADALTALIRRNGGSIEEALDNMKIKDGPTRGSIKHWYGWDEEEYIGTYTVLVTDENGDPYDSFEIEAPSRERAEEIVNNIVCELTTNGAFNDIKVYTDDPEDGMLLLTTLSQIGAAEFKEDNISFMDGLTFELQ